MGVLDEGKRNIEKIAKVEHLHRACTIYQEHQRIDRWKHMIPSLRLLTCLSNTRSGTSMPAAFSKTEKTPPRAPFAQNHKGEREREIVSDCQRFLALLSKMCMYDIMDFLSFAEASLAYLAWVSPLT